MKNCVRCSESIEDNIKFCPRCGANQYSQNATFLIVLCVLTIIGSVSVIARGFLYEMVSTIDEESTYLRGWVYVITGVGTLVGAIMMLNRKRIGLYIYTAFQAIYLLAVLYAAMTYAEDGSTGMLAFGIAGLFAIPSAAFLAMYWTNTCRKHLF